MRSIKMKGRVVIGDFGGSETPAPRKGQAKPADLPEVDVAIDALQSLDSVAFGRPYAIATIAVSSPDSFLVPPVPYMNKIAVGPEAAGHVDIKASPLDNLVGIADAKRCYVEDLTVCILDRERHRALIDDVRAAGARIQLISDGDLTAMLATAIASSGIDVVMGVGGSAEGVLAAAALKSSAATCRRSSTPATTPKPKRCAPPVSPARTGCCTRTTSCAARTRCSRPPASPTAKCSRASSSCPGAR
jgi:fructose-1,6-bisphosphatase II